MADPEPVEAYLPRMRLEVEPDVALIPGDASASPGVDGQPKHRGDGWS
jgi:hypothetical protein